MAWACLRMYGTRAVNKLLEGKLGEIKKEDLD
jgi:hypothetical protein